MTEMPIQGGQPTGLTGAGRTDGVQPTKGANASPSERATESPAFHVLLERLQARAAELEAETEGATDAENLAGAVDTARASLEDAVSLSDRILEAYRAAEQQGEASGENEEERP